MIGTLQPLVKNHQPIIHLQPLVSEHPSRSCRYIHTYIYPSQLCYGLVHNQVFFWLGSSSQPHELWSALIAGVSEPSAPVVGGRPYPKKTNFRDGSHKEEALDG